MTEAGHSSPEGLPSFPRAVSPRAGPLRHGGARNDGRNWFHPCGTILYFAAGPYRIGFFVVAAAGTAAMAGRASVPLRRTLVPVRVKKSGNDD